MVFILFSIYQKKGVLLSTLGLVEEIMHNENLNRVKMVKFIPPMVRVLKGLVSSYSAEFDISGVADPYL